MNAVLELVVRLLVAAVFGALIGYERELRAKGAGIRTHVLVAIGSSLFMLISQFGFPDAAKFDAARIAAGVVGGLGFLGGGIIMKTKSHVSGLTTAAGIWLTAGIGLAVGAGMFVVGVCGTAMIMVIQYILHRFTVGGDAYSGNHIQFTVQNGYDFNQALEDQLKEWKAQVTESKVTRRKDGTTDYDLILRRREALTYSELKAFMVTREDVLSFSNSALQTQFY